MENKIYYLDREYNWFGEFILNIDNKDYIFSGIISYKPNESFYLELINTYEMFDNLLEFDKICKINKINAIVSLENSRFKEYATIYCFHFSQYYDNNCSISDLDKFKYSSIHPRLNKIFFEINIIYFHNNNFYEENNNKKEFFINFNNSLENFFYDNPNLFECVNKEINLPKEPFKLDENCELMFLQAINYDGYLNVINDNNNLLKKYFLSNNDENLFNKINDEINAIFEKNNITLYELNREQIKIILNFIIYNKSILEHLEYFYKIEKLFKILNNNFNIGINGINMIDKDYCGDFKILYLLSDYNINMQEYRCSFEENFFYNDKIKYKDIKDDFKNIIQNFCQKYDSLKDIIFILNENHFYNRFTYLYLSRTIDCICYISKNYTEDKYKYIIEKYFENNKNIIKKIKNILRPIEKKYKENKKLSDDDYGKKISELRASITHFSEDMERKINISNLKILNDIFELLLKCFIFEEIGVKEKLIERIKNYHNNKYLR